MNSSGGRVVAGSNPVIPTEGNWGASGRWFESSHPDRRKCIDNHLIINAFVILKQFI